RFKVCCHLLDRPCRIEPADDRKPPVGTRIQQVSRFKVGLRADRDGHIKIAPNRHPEEIRRRNSDDLNEFVVELELLAQRRAATEFLLPEAVADDCAWKSTAR